MILYLTLKVCILFFVISLSVFKPFDLYYSDSFEDDFMIIVDDAVELRKKLIEKFKNELPVLRARAKLSQESVAEKIGISRQTYSGIETGKREMSWTMFLALLAFFQNNELTKQYLSKMDGFEDEFIQVIGQTECGKQNSEITIE